MYNVNNLFFKFTIEKLTFLLLGFKIIIKRISSYKREKEIKALETHLPQIFHITKDESLVYCFQK